MTTQTEILGPGGSFGRAGGGQGFNRLAVRGEFSSSLKGVPNAGWNGSRNMRILSLNSTKRTHGTHAQMVIEDDLT